MKDEAATPAARSENRAAAMAETSAKDSASPNFLATSLVRFSIASYLLMNACLNLVKPVGEIASATL